MYNILKNQKSRLTKNPKLLNKIVLTPGQFHWVLTPKELYYSFHPFPIAPCVNDLSPSELYDFFPHLGIQV